MSEFSLRDSVFYSPSTPPMPVIGVPGAPATRARRRPSNYAKLSQWNTSMFAQKRHSRALQIDFLEQRSMLSTIVGKPLLNQSLISQTTLAPFIVTGNGMTTSQVQMPN